MRKLGRPKLKGGPTMRSGRSHPTSPSAAFAHTVTLGLAFHSRCRYSGCSCGRHAKRAGLEEPPAESATHVGADGPATHARGHPRKRLSPPGGLVAPRQHLVALSLPVSSVSMRADARSREGARGWSLSPGRSGKGAEMSPLARPAQQPPSPSPVPWSTAGSAVRRTDLPCSRPRTLFETTSHSPGERVQAGSGVDVGSLGLGPV